MAEFQDWLKIVLSTYELANSRMLNRTVSRLAQQLNHKSYGPIDVLKVIPATGYV
jgi:hypothetical protein